MFINDLGKPGVNKGGARSIPCIDLLPLLKEKGKTQKRLAQLAGVGCSTVSTACRGESISTNTAKALAKVLNCNADAIFANITASTTLSPKTIRNYLSFVSSILDYAYKNGMIQSNPATRVVPPPLETKEKQIYSTAEAQAFIDSLDNAPVKYKTFCILGIYGGFRRGEILGLEWRDIDFQTCVISIRRTSQYTKEQGLFTDTTKTVKSQRSLKLPKSVFAILKHHRAEQARAQLLLGDQWTSSNRLFVDNMGKPLNPNAPYSWLKRFCIETGQRFLGVHHFRHLNATLLINSGADARTVSSSLGHSQVSTTFNIYAHTFEEAQARAGEAVAAVLDREITLKQA